MPHYICKNAFAENLHVQSPKTTHRFVERTATFDESGTWNPTKVSISQRTDGSTSNCALWWYFRSSLKGCDEAPNDFKCSHGWWKTFNCHCSLLWVWLLHWFLAWVYIPRTTDPVCIEIGLEIGQKSARTVRVSGCDHFCWPRGSFLDLHTQGSCRFLWRKRPFGSFGQDNSRERLDPVLDWSLFLYGVQEWSRSMTSSISQTTSRFICQGFWNALSTLALQASRIEPTPVLTWCVYADSTVFRSPSGGRVVNVRGWQDNRSRLLSKLLLLTRVFSQHC